jgi:hypothetical protein
VTVEPPDLARGARVRARRRAEGPVGAGDGERRGRGAEESGWAEPARRKPDRPARPVAVERRQAWRKRARRDPAGRVPRGRLARGVERDDPYRVIRI